MRLYSWVDAEWCGTRSSAAPMSCSMMVLSKENMRVGRAVETKTSDGYTMGYWLSLFDITDKRSVL